MMSSIKISVFLLPIVLNISSSLCVVISDPYETARRLQSDYNLYDIFSSKLGRHQHPSSASALQKLLRLADLNESIPPPAIPPSEDQSDFEDMRDVLSEINDDYPKRSRLSSITKRKVFWQPLGYVPAAMRVSGSKGQNSESNSGHQNGNILRYG